MLGNTITLTIDTTPKVLLRVRENDFSSTYLLKETNSEIQLDIRHQLEKKAPNDPQMERHNMDLKFTTFDPTTGKPSVRQVYTVFRFPRGTDPTAVGFQMKSLCSYLVSSHMSFINWDT